MSNPALSGQRLSVSVGFVLFIFSAFVRILGMDWGLPNEKHLYSYHPDEPILLGYSQQINPLAGDFDPGFYNYPTFYLTLSRVASDFVNAYGGGPKPIPEGASQDPGALQAEQARVMRNYHLAGRWISLLAGSGMVWVMFAWLRRRFGMASSVMGSLLVAFAPGLVMHSCFQTVDITAVFFVTLSLFWAYRAWEQAEDPLKPALLAGLFAGLSAGTKYTGILAVVALVGFALKPGALQRAKSIAMALGMALLAFLITTPGCLINSSKFVEDFKYEMLHTSTGHGLVFAGTPSGFLYHWINITATTSMLAMILGAMGLFLMGWRAVKQDDPEASWSWAYGPLAFFLLTYLLIGRSEVKFLRYVFPLIPVLALGVAALLDQTSKRERVQWLAPILGIFAFMGIGGGGMQSTLLNLFEMLKLDARERAANVLSDENSVGIVSDPWYYSPALFPESAAPRSVPFEVREAWRTVARKPQVLRFVPENPDERVDWDPRLITELKPEAIVFSSFEFDDMDRVARLNIPQFEGQIKNFREFTSLLTSKYALDQTIGGITAPIHDLQYISPKLWVYKLKPSETTSKSSSTTSSLSEAPLSTP